MANASNHTYIFKIAERSQTVMPLSGIWGSISTKWVGFGVKLEFLAGLRRGRRPNAISEEFSHFTPILEALEPPEEKIPKIRLSTCMVHRIWEPNPLSSAPATTSTQFYRNGEAFRCAVNLPEVMCDDLLASVRSVPPFAPLRSPSLPKPSKKRKR